MSNASPHISIPVLAETLTRGDILRVRRGSGYADLQVTGVKFMPAKENLPDQVRVNVLDAGKRKSLFFLRYHDISRTSERYVNKVVPIPELPEARFPVHHIQVSDGVFVQDDVGDIAVRCGAVMKWVRVNGRWSDGTEMFQWNSELFRKWKLFRLG